MYQFEKYYLNKEYDKENLYIWYAEKEQEIIATMMLKDLKNGIGIIENVCCINSYRGMGIAEQIMEKIIELSYILDLKKLQLGTYSNLERAMAFYKKYGFVEQEELRNEVEQARYFELVL